jgi:hypothetical protein
MSGPIPHIPRCVAMLVSDAAGFEWISNGCYLTVL